MLLAATSVNWVNAQQPAQQPTNIAPAPLADSSIAHDPSLSGDVAAAEDAILKSDWKIATLKLGAWLTNHPTDARALFDAGYVADAQNRMADAASFYRRAVVADPKAFAAHLSLGLLLARQDKSDEARPELVLATTLDPGDLGAAMKARAWRALAEIDKSIDSAAASSDLIAALKLTPETPADTLLAANIAEIAGQSDEAEATYRRLLKKAPHSTDAQSGLAHLLIVKKQFAEAEILLRDALEQSPDNPTLTAQLATVLTAQDKAEALPVIEKLHDAHPDDPTISRMLAEVLATAGDTAGSETIYKKLLLATPNDTELLLAHARNLIHLLQYPAAFAAYDQATKLDPNNPDGWSGLAFAAERTHQPAISLQALDMRAKYLPENASSYYLRAIAHDTLHHKKEAIKNYRLYLESPTGKASDHEWQARERLKLLEK